MAHVFRSVKSPGGENLGSLGAFSLGLSQFLATFETAYYLRCVTEVHNFLVNCPPDFSLCEFPSLSHFNFCSEYTPSLSLVQIFPAFETARRLRCITGAYHFGCIVTWEAIPSDCTLCERVHLMS